MRTFLNTTFFILSLALGSPAWTYDAEMAKSYEQLFSNVVGAESAGLDARHTRGEDEVRAVLDALLKG